MLIMAGKSKQEKPPCKIMPYVGKNIDRLLNKFYSDYSETVQAEELAKDIGFVGKNTIIRLRKNKNAPVPGIDTIELIAEHFGLAPHQLLMPNLDIDLAKVQRKKRRKAA